MKILVVIISIYLLTFSYTVFSQSHYKYIVTEEYNFYDDLKIDRDSTDFNGYLIFKILRKLDLGLHPLLTDYYSCNVFWVTNISDINFVDKHYLYDPLFLLDLPRHVISYLSDSTGESLPSDKKKLIEFYLQFHKYRDINVSETPFLFYNLSTQIFEQGINLLANSQSDSVGYFIFSCSFKAAIFTGKLYCTDYNSESVNENGDKIYKYITIENAKVMVPISSCCDFKPTDSKLLNSNGYFELSWFPENLYNNSK